MRSSFRSIKAAAALLLASLAAAVPAATSPRRLPPVDQCASDRSFAAFRSDLLKVIAAKDSKRLLALLAKDVTVDFGGGAGKADFAATWGLDKPGSSRLWSEAAKALALGCVRHGQSLSAPSLGGQLGDHDEPFELVLALPGALLKAAPSDTAPTMLKLHWHILTVGARPERSPWVAAALSDGRKGFVREDGLRSPLDYRFVFEKRGGRWLVTAFVAGD